MNRQYNNGPRVIEMSASEMNFASLLIHNSNQTILGALGQEKGHALLGDRFRADWDFAQKTNLNVRTIDMEELRNYGEYGDVYMVGLGTARLSLMGYHTTDPDKAMNVIVIPDQKPRTGQSGRFNAADNKAFRSALADAKALEGSPDLQPKWIVPGTHSFYKVEGEEKEVRVVYIIASQIGSVSSDLNRAPRPSLSHEEETPEHELETELATS